MIGCHHHKLSKNRALVLEGQQITQVFNARQIKPKRLNQSKTSKSKNISKKEKEANQGVATFLL